jgi:hypothetical protein
LLAGDFFANHVKYREFLDSIDNEKMYNRFLHYVRGRTNPLPDDAYCDYSFEEIYGHLPEEEPVPEIDKVV